jgi:hypothetical protein
MTHLGNALSPVLLILLILLAIGGQAPGNSSAATITLPQTGQFKCYSGSRIILSQNSYINTTSEIVCTGTGQDGDLKAGAIWPIPRFVDNGDGTVTDNLTALSWSKNANLMKSRDPGFDLDSYAGYDNSVPGDGKVTWQHALDYIKKLNDDGYAGHSDWRLPNALEMGSLDFTGLYDPCPRGVNYFYCFADHFTAVSGTNYWSSTTAQHHADACIQLGGQRSSAAKSSNKMVWPVRGMSAGETALPQTGQTDCYNAAGEVVSCSGTGQDGELQAGMPRPQARSTDNGDGTFTDNLTGLIWTKDTETPGPAACSPGSSLAWRDVASYIRCLNINGYLGHSDWRLPNTLERGSLADFGPLGMGWLAPPNINPAVTDLSYRWSSSFMSVNGMVDSVWTGIVYKGVWDIFFNSGKVWPVRGGTFPALKQYSVTGKATPAVGQVTCTPPVVNSGASTSCTFSLQRGCVLTSLLDNNNDVTGLVSGNTYPLTGVSENHFITAANDCGNKFRVYVFAQTSGAGVITSNPPGMVCDTKSYVGCDYAFEKGTTVELIASPNWMFISGGWSGGMGLSASNTISFTDKGSANEYYVTPIFLANNQAKLLSTGALYVSLLAAYQAAGPDATVQARLYVFEEELLFDSAKTIKLEGGKDVNYLDSVGVTTIKGSLTVRKGTVRVRNVAIR